MRITPFTDDISAYLKEDEVIDFNKSIITQLADKLYEISDSEISYIKYVYERYWHKLLLRGIYHL